MKTILLPTEDHESMPAVLETARLIARRFDSYMEGFAVRPIASGFVAVDPVSNLTLPTTDEGDAEIVKQARDAFEGFMRAHDVPQAQPGPAKYSCGWVRQAAEDDSFVGSYGRLFDLTVLGRPGRGPQHPRMLPLEAALFESGHPVLLVPRTAPKSLGQNVLIAWNGSTEQARTNKFALPFLREAEKVTVLTVQGGTVPGPSGEQAVDYLRRHAVPATAVTVAPGTRSTGEAVLDHARKLGCDLLVKGAYTQSRLRQMIFGGTTRHILAHAELPVLMAH
jgi:nucleotide-binding universal stress UspA family protein